MSKRQKHARSAGSREDREDGDSDLADAALALGREIVRFEELTAAARRMPLDTRKGIERAAKTTTEAAETQQAVGMALGALVAAIGAARERHETNAAALAARGAEIESRAAQLEELFLRYATLGDEGKAINQLVQQSSARQREASTPEQIREILVTLDDVDERMARLVDGARDLVQAATAANIVDIAEQGEGMRQQIVAVRNKVGLLHRELSARIPTPSLLN